MAGMSKATGSVSPLGRTGYQQVTIPKDQRIQDIFNTLMGGASQGVSGGLSQLSQLAAGGSPEMWGQLEAPALRQFQDLAGGLGARFSGMGTGAQRSSGFKHALGGAAGDLAQQLQSQRLGLQQGAQDRLLQLYQNLMGANLSDSFLMEKQKKKPWYQELLGSLAPSLGQGLGQLGGLGSLKYLGLLG